MATTIRRTCIALFVAFTVASCGSNSPNAGSSASTTTSPAPTTSTQAEDETVSTTEVSDAANEGLGTSGFEELSAFITETATFRGPTGQSVTLVAELSDQTLPFELFLFIGEWTESHQEDSSGQVFLSEETAYSFQIAYTCAQIHGWLTHVEGSTFQWRGGFPPGGDESGEDCDPETSDLAFVEDLLENADSLELVVDDNTLELSFDGYAATWIPRVERIPTTGDESLAVMSFSDPECSNSGRVVAFGRTWNQVSGTIPQSWREREPIDGLFLFASLERSTFEADGERIEMTSTGEIDAECTLWPGQ